MPTLAGESALAAQPVVPARSWRWVVGVPVLLVVSLAVGLGILGLRSARTPGARPTTGDEPSPQAQLRQKTTEARQALAAGNFQLAVAALDAARTASDQLQGVLFAEELRQLRQLHRQAALLADLLDQPLGDILHQAVASADEQDWQAIFARRYRGRAVVFEAEVRRDASGRYHLGYALAAGQQPATLEMSDLALLALLPLDAPVRLLFGGRLASIRRERFGEWVVRLEPDSGVLLTDTDAVVGLGLDPREPDLAAALQRQRGWLADLP